MKTDITLTVLTGVLIEIQNKCSSMGCYFGEDDWQAIGVGETLEEAIIQVANDVERHKGINSDGITFTDVEFVDYDDQYIILKKGQELGQYSGNHAEYLEKKKLLLDSEAWKNMLFNLEAKKVEAQRIKKEQDDAKKESDERAQLERLKKKYETS